MTSSVADRRNQGRHAFLGSILTYLASKGIPFAAGKIADWVRAAVKKMKDFKQVPGSSTKPRAMLGSGFSDVAKPKMTSALNAPVIRLQRKI